MKESYTTGSVGVNDSFAVVVGLEDEDGEALDETRIRFWSRGRWGASLDLDFKAVDLAPVPNRPSSFAVLGMEGEVVWVDNALTDRVTTRSDAIGDRSLAARTTIRSFSGGLAITGMGREVHWSNGGPWRRLGTGVGDEKGKLVGFEALRESGESILYAAGWRGELWCMENEAWRSTDSPTNLILTGLTVAPDGQQMYCCGRQGMLLRGDKTHWTVVEHGLAEDFWSVECFRGRVFVASLRSIFELKGERLERVDDGSPAGSYYRLSANDDVLLSVGSAALLLFDGDRWAAID